MKYNLLTIWSILVNLKNVPVESKASRVPITASPVAESGAATVVVKADIAACWLKIILDSSRKMLLYTELPDSTNTV